MPPTKLSARLINTRQLFSVKEILLSRGYEVIKEDTYAKLLITEENIYDEIWQEVFKIFNERNLRVELKDFLYSKRENIESIEIKKLLSHPKFIKDRVRFNNTFEWFAGEIMIKKFAAFSASFGITVRDIIRNSTETAAGDYDALIVLRDTKLAYFECKAGGFDESSLMKCYERMLSLNCEYSIFICIEKINEEKLLWSSSKVRIPVTNLHELNKINIKNRIQDIIYDLHNCYIIDMFGDIESKIRTILRINAAKINQLHYSFYPSNDTFDKLGYSIQTLATERYSGL